MSSAIVVRTNPKRRKRRAKGKQIVVVQQQQKKRKSRRGRRRKGKGNSIFQASSFKSNGYSRRKRPLGLYTQSLLHPESVSAKIPDMETWPSSTFQVDLEGTLSTASDGSTAAIFYPSPITGTGLGAGGGAPAIQGTAIETSAVQGNWLTQTAIVSPASTSLINLLSMHRPVSACLLVEFIGTTSNDGGQIAACPIFRDELAPQNFSTAINNQNVFACPLRNGIRYLWRPMDEADFSYEPTQATAVTGIYSTGVARPTTAGPSQTIPVAQFLPKAAIALYISGAAATTKVARFRWIVNYEGVPEFASEQFIETTPSDSNPGLLAQGMNAMSSLPWGSVWQEMGGIAGSLAYESLKTQLPNLAGALGSHLLGKGQARLNYNYALD